MMRLPAALYDRSRAEKANPNYNVRCNTRVIIAREGVGGEQRKQARANPYKHMRSKSCRLVTALTVQADNHAQESCPDERECSLGLQFE
jgi:hypothetical protein